ncbi:hypothetical protein QWY85_16245 [Neolewinella lacunae]|uniref:Uncharacterized protein n=1 Tax=Neolewinella lacunae TaxID=1517758 RepID=A0A923T7E7_9BACT|nr:hypothetical protein [Neolewinella lacunae]MBC6993504.1 hypothetical protein [Neolewinella lacunae]MDN3636220.1 hypothetical protein [Neolewinella lacunae]
MKELREVINYYLKTHDTEWLQDDMSFIISLIALIGTITIILLKFFRYVIENYKKRLLIKDMSPFYTYSEVHKATNNFIEPRSQNVPPNDFEELSENNSIVISKPIIDFFMDEGFTDNNNSSGKFYFILAGAGMGKTTFLLNLYLKYKYSFFKFWARNKYSILMFPLGYEDVDSEIEKIKNKENTILLLDAFDEDMKASHDIEKRLDDLYELTWRFRKVVITCRTQFFANENSEPNLTKVKKYGGEKGFHNVGKLYLSPFDDKEVTTYLKRKFIYRLFPKFRKYSNAKSVMNHSGDLLVRPMLLSYIDTILDTPIPKYSLPNLTYSSLIKSWLQRESNRNTPDDREVYFNNLYDFSVEVAKHVYVNSISDLRISQEEAIKIADDNHIVLNKIDVTSRSLLNRDSKGFYKFSHKSILEYFLSIYLLRNNSEVLKFDFKSFDLCGRFYLFYGLTIGYKKLQYLKIRDIHQGKSIYFDDSEWSDFCRHGANRCIGEIENILYLYINFRNKIGLEYSGMISYPHYEYSVMRSKSENLLDGEESFLKARIELSSVYESIKNNKSYMEYLQTYQKKNAYNNSVDESLYEGLELEVNEKSIRP